MLHPKSPVYSQGLTILRNARVCLCMCSSASLVLRFRVFPFFLWTEASLFASYLLQLQLHCCSLCQKVDRATKANSNSAALHFILVFLCYTPIAALSEPIDKARKQSACLSSRPKTFNFCSLLSSFVLSSFCSPRSFCCGWIASLLGNARKSFQSLITSRQAQVGASLNNSDPVLNPQAVVSSGPIM